MGSRSHVASRQGPLPTEAVLLLRYQTLHASRCQQVPAGADGPRQDGQLYPDTSMQQLGLDMSMTHQVEGDTSRQATRPKPRTCHLLKVSTAPKGGMGPRNPILQGDYAHSN